MTLTSATSEKGNSRLFSRTQDGKLLHTVINRLAGPSSFSSSAQITQSNGAVLDRSGGPALLGVHVRTMIQKTAVL